MTSYFFSAQNPGKGNQEQQPRECRKNPCIIRVRRRPREQRIVCEGIGPKEAIKFVRLFLEHFEKAGERLLLPEITSPLFIEFLHQRVIEFGRVRFFALPEEYGSDVVIFFVKHV